MKCSTHLIGFIASLDGWLTDDAEKARQIAKTRGIRIWDTFKTD